MIDLGVLLILSYLLLHLFTISKPYESNEVKLVITGICVNCNPEGQKVELNQFGQCAYCLSESILKREPKRLILTAGERIVKRLKK